MDYPNELLLLLQPGRIVRLRYGSDNPNNQLRHIRAIVDDDQIVYRVWSRSRRRWDYHVETTYGFWLAWCDGALTNA